MAVVAVAGSRTLSPSLAPLVADVCASLSRAGCSIVTGEASGADGYCRASCPDVRAFRASSFLPSAPWRARLAARTRAVVAAAAAGGPGSALVVFLASPSSRGSLLACRLAVSFGLPVIVFPCGFPASALPSLGAGSWSPAGSGVWSGACRWLPTSLFGDPWLAGQAAARAGHFPEA
jgi:hypothetical protein